MNQFYDGDIPTGSIDGVNAAFVLSAAPSPVGSLTLFRNGVLQTAGVDYTLSGATVTFVAASIPQTGDALISWYRAGGTVPVGGLGILRDDAIVLIQQRAGNRTGHEAKLILEMQSAQRKFESSPFLPWFLISSVDESISSSPMSAPDGFLREIEDEDCLLLVEAEGLTPIYKNDYGFLARNEDLRGTGPPSFYGMVGSDRHLFTVPDISYTIRTLFYRAAAVLDTNISNVWLDRAPDLLIAETGMKFAAFLRDKDALALFKEDRDAAMKALIVGDAAFRQAAMHHFMGGV